MIGGSIMEQTVITKKMQRKENRRTGKAVLIYVLIVALITFVWSMVDMGVTIANLAQGKNITDHVALNALVDEAIPLVASRGWGMILSVVVGLLFLFLIYRKQGIHKELFKTEKKMSVKVLLLMACTIFLGDGIGTMFTQPLETFANLFGKTIVAPFSTETDAISTVSMFLYACILGPVAEELVFRGFLMRGLEKRGKVLAVVATSILFGLMHGNAAQLVPTVMFGLLAGYVAMEYSMIWSIVLHIFNNLVLCYLLPMATAGCSEAVQNAIVGGLTLVALIVAVVAVIRNIDRILVWCRSEKWEKKQFRNVMVNFPVILFTVYETVWMVMNLQAL